MFLVQCARNAPEYFADRLWRSMKGAGTNDSLLIRLVVSRSEVSFGYFSNHLVLIISCFGSIQPTFTLCLSPPAQGLRIDGGGNGVRVPKNSVQLDRPR